MFKKVSLVTIVLAVALTATAARSGEVYLFDEAVEGKIDVVAFQKTGKVTLVDGSGELCDTEGGPAPPPYPQIRVWEPGYEQLGASNNESDGIWFIHGGKNWKKNRWVLVLWKIRVPEAAVRSVDEFDQDMTLSLWVDWDQNEAWDKNELVVRKDVNIGNRFPNDKGTLRVCYLTCFRVPDVTEMTATSWWWGRKRNKEIREYWVRGSLAYDDPDVSPDGEQLFGEAEDYRVSYELPGNSGEEGE